MQTRTLPSRGRLSVPSWPTHAPRKPERHGRRSLAAPKCLSENVTRNSPRTKQSSHPQVDWSRFHLQLLFVDSDDCGAARIAHGMFESIAIWNGYGRSLYPWSAGTGAHDADPSKVVSMMSQAESLGFSSRLFARSPEQLELNDLYMYDMVIAMDSTIEEAILARFSGELDEAWDDAGDREFYRQRVCKLSDFLSYATDKQLTNKGLYSLLPEKMMRLCVQDGKRLPDDPSAALASFETREQWNDKIPLILLGLAGLVQYAMDSCPEDLDYYWLE